jgi:hypothetical protein
MKKNICGSCLKFKTKECPHGTSAYMEATNPACSQHSLGKYVSGDDEPEAKPKANKAIPLEPELLPPETNALTHSRTNELPSLFSPDQVTGQYRRANAGMLEVVRFGAMLMEIEQELRPDAITNRHHKGNGGLEKWIADNCPDVNYNTALQYKRLAAAMLRTLGAPAKVRPTLLIPELDGLADASEEIPEAKRGKVIEVRGQILESVNGKGLYQCMFDFGLAERKPQGGSREGSGRPTVKDVPAQTRAGAAWAKIGQEIDLAQAWKFTRFLPPGIAKEALETVTLLRDSLKERLEETKKGGSHVK